MKVDFFIICLFSLMATMANTSHALTFTYNHGELTGISDFVYNENIYDISFVEGSAFELFYKNNSWDFVFTTDSSVEDAAFALLGLIKSDTTLNLTPSLMNGIEESTGYALIPYSFDGIYVWSWGPQNTPQIDDFSIYQWALTSNDNTLSNSYTTYAVWNKQFSTVPAPPVVALMLTGLVVLRIFRSNIFKVKKCVS